MSAPLYRGALARLAALLPSRTDLEQIRRDPRRDLLAGLTVAVVALPLALGFGVSSGLGAEAGLATAVVAGTLAAVFGGSNLQVSGPTGAMTVVLVPIVGAYGPGGVLTVGLMAGVMLVVLAGLRAGRYMRYIPAPVVEGFTLGIACVIGLQQIPNALGVPKPDGDRVLVVAWRAAEEFAKAPNWTALGLAAAVAALMLAGARWRPTVPFSLLAVAAATAVAQLAHLDAAKPIGDLPAGLPAPSLAFLDPGALGTLLAPAVAVAALAALESLLSASVADGMTVGQQHDPDRELFGQGLANIAAPLFGGVPATGAIARTAVNVRTGAASRLAALTHAAVLALIVFAAAPLVSKIPLAALAGVLLATAIRMVEVGSLKAMARATRSDAAILVLTAAATLAAWGAPVRLDVIRTAILSNRTVPGEQGDGAVWDTDRIVSALTPYGLDAVVAELRSGVGQERPEGQLSAARAWLYVLSPEDEVDDHLDRLRLGRSRIFGRFPARVPPSRAEAVFRYFQDTPSAATTGPRRDHETLLTLAATSAEGPTAVAWLVRFLPGGDLAGAHFPQAHHYAYEAARRARVRILRDRTIQPVPVTRDAPPASPVPPPPV
ncbi:SulP family inorganic anion transporter [Streptomyces niveiscabiei]|uniref:SulP family inorganic anion transporter n=1 Tax=Streptomyces niveiscabiei TaxID=164115 RepID=UPI001F0A5FB8|nr:SulP family inorganic anion transporter [Streptomyces niveiscabiei]